MVANLNLTPVNIQVFFQEESIQNSQEAYNVLITSSGKAPAGPGSNQGVLQMFCFNFHKMNRCNYILATIAVIQQFPNE